MSGELERTMRVALVDDHRLVLDALHAALDGWPEVEVVGSYQDVATALADLVGRPVDLVLLDRRLEGVDGIDAIRPIRELVGAQVLMLTGAADDDEVARALAEGACCVAYKEIELSELRQLVRQSRPVRPSGDPRCD